MSAWGRVNRRPRPSMACAIALGLYLLVLFAEPFLHHSVACHANTPTHCTACHLQTISHGVEDDGLIQTITALPEAGKLLPASWGHDRAPLVTRTNDRSPPHA